MTAFTRTTITTISLLEGENQQLKKTVKELVELVDQLRQPYNNSRRHDLYLMATEALNRMEEQGRIL